MDHLSCVLFLFWKWKILDMNMYPSCGPRKQFFSFLVLFLFLQEWVWWKILFKFKNVKKTPKTPNFDISLFVFLIFNLKCIMKGYWLNNIYFYFFKQTISYLNHDDSQFSERLFEVYILRINWLKKLILFTKLCS